MTKEKDPRKFSLGDWEAFKARQDYHNEQSIRMDTVELRGVEWFWKGFIPRGMVTIITGEEGLGKSQLALRMAARFSTSETEVNPEDRGDGGNVKIYSAEDPLHQVLAPRLLANEANMKHVYSEGINIQTFLPDGIDDIMKGIQDLGFGMVIIDPVIAYIGAKHDSNKAQDVRLIMRMLADLAEQTNTIIIGVMHPKKGEEAQVLHKMIGGSSAFGQAARSVLGVARHPDEVDQRIVGRIKGNLSKPPSPWIYEIKPQRISLGAKEKIWTSRVEMIARLEDDEFDLAAVLQGRAPKKQKTAKAEDLTALNKAILWMQAELIREGEMAAKVLVALGHEAGFGRSTVYRAKDELGIRSVKRDGHYWWSLPSEGEDS